MSKKITLEQNRLLRARELADLLGVAPRTVAQWLADGLIPSVKIGRRTRRFIRSEVEEWLGQSVGKENASRG